MQLLRIIFKKHLDKNENLKLTKSIQLSKLENFMNKNIIDYNYIVGEDGSKLSGGQRQRLGVALGMNFGAYGAEIVRAGILAVPKGQWEAAHSLNFTPSKRIKRIIIPQIFPIILPPAANLTVELLKATALVALVTVVDLTFEAKQINSITWLSAQCFGTALLIYYIMARFALVPY